MMPLVRWEFRELPENARGAFYFTNVTDCENKKYAVSALIACCAPSREIVNVQ